jgi:hypothetical protein
MLKKILHFLFYFLIFLLILLVSLFTLSSEEVAEEQQSRWQTNLANLKKLNFENQQDTAHLEIGWAKQNISPSGLAPFAGYGLARAKSAKVHDSLYVRAVAFRKGNQKVVVLAYDLLIAPPLVARKLAEKLPQIGLKRENLFFTATHTHHSLGGWAEGLAGIFMAAGEDEQIILMLVNQSFEAIKQAQKNLQNATIAYAQADASEYVKSRLHDQKELLDTKLRYLALTQQNGKSACLFSYSAHATCIDGLSEAFSRDYAGEAVDFLEKNGQNDAIPFDFAVFSAGMVASHTPTDFGLHNYAWTRKTGQGIAEVILKNKAIQIEKNTQLYIQHLRVEMGKTNLRLSKDIKLRDWVFKSLYPYPEIYISILKIGNILWLGMPCDFSGELMPQLSQLAEKQGLKLIVTSFNGAYMGYVTPDKYYNWQHYETMELNWLGKKGDEFVKILSEIINYSSHSH